MQLTNAMEHRSDTTVWLHRRAALVRIRSRQEEETRSIGQVSSIQIGICATRGIESRISEGRDTKRSLRQAPDDVPSRREISAKVGAPVGFAGFIARIISRCSKFVCRTCQYNLSNRSIFVQRLWISLYEAQPSERPKYIRGCSSDWYVKSDRARRLKRGGRGVTRISITRVLDKRERRV